MTLQQFEKAVQEYVPNFRIRQAGYGDVVGAFVGNDYLFRLSKGDLPLYSWRTSKVIGYQPRMQDGKIYEEPIIDNKRKRGRMQALHLLVNYRHLTQRQAQKIMWGI